MSDPRQDALLRGLRQLNSAQLRRLLDHLNSGAPILLDRDEGGAANYSIKRDCYCPLAVAIDAPDLMKYVPFEDRDAKLQDFMRDGLGLSINNTRGVKGEFYTERRRVDLTWAAVEVWQERGRR